MAQIYKLQNIPSVADYDKALKALGSQVKETHLRLFRAHYGAPIVRQLQNNLQNGLK